MLEQFVSLNDLQFLFNLVFAAIIGLAIGIEREMRHKDAGISTHTLVIMGSMLFTYLSVFFEPDHAARIAAQVVMGVGFLGGGLIIREGTVVHNLTTAASLWFAAAIGMAIGIGSYPVATFAAIAAVLVPRIPHYPDRRTDENPNAEEKKSTRARRKTKIVPE